MNTQSLPQPTYANVVGIRTTSVELILDFGCLFGAPTQMINGPENLESSVRLVLPINAIRAFSEALVKAADAHEKTMASATASVASKKEA